MTKGNLLIIIGALILIFSINLMMLYEPTKAMILIVFNSIILGSFLSLLGVYFINKKP